MGPEPEFQRELVSDKIGYHFSYLDFAVVRHGMDVSRNIVHGIVAVDDKLKPSAYNSIHFTVTIKTCRAVPYGKIYKRPFNYTGHRRAEPNAVSRDSGNVTAVDIDTLSY